MSNKKFEEGLEKECLDLLRSYEKLSKLFNVCEGEFIQELYFLIKEYKMNTPIQCDEDKNGILIPTVRDCDEIQKSIVELIEKRADKVKNVLNNH